MDNCAVCGGTKKVTVIGIIKGYFASNNKKANEDEVLEIKTTCTCSIVRQPIKDNDKTNNSLSEGF